MLKNDTFTDEILSKKDSIQEVYFALGDLPHGRGIASESNDEIPAEYSARLFCDLGRFSKAGIPLDVLLNGNCYGADALSRSFFSSIGNSLDRLCSLFRIKTVTTTSPLIGKFIHENFEKIDVRASVNIGIGTEAAFDYVREYYDSYYLKREYNRDINKLMAAKKWCVKNSKELYLLANSGCLNDCSAHTYHDNLVAHESEIEKRDNAYTFSGICRDYLSRSENSVSLIRDCNYIRPDDIPLYEGLVSAVKLATRVNRYPERILDAYVQKRYIGPVTDLLEPDNGSALLPMIIDNSRFPSEFGDTVMRCARNCEDCSYCRDVLKMASADLSEMIL